MSWSQRRPGWRRNAPLHRNPFYADYWRSGVESTGCEWEAWPRASRPAGRIPNESQDSHPPRGTVWPCFAPSSCPRGVLRQRNRQPHRSLLSSPLTSNRRRPRLNPDVHLGLRTTRQDPIRPQPPRPPAHCFSVPSHLLLTAGLTAGLRPIRTRKLPTHPKQPMPAARSGRAGKFDSSSPINTVERDGTCDCGRRLPARSLPSISWNAPRLLPEHLVANPPPAGAADHSVPGQPVGLRGDTGSNHDSICADGGCCCARPAPGPAPAHRSPDRLASAGRISTGGCSASASSTAGAPACRTVGGDSPAPGWRKGADADAPPQPPSSRQHRRAGDRDGPSQAE